MEKILQITCENRGGQVQTNQFKVTIDQCDSEVLETVNYAPEFVEQPEEVIIQGQSSFAIPDYFDILGDEIFVEVKNLQPFMSYNNESEVIEFSGE